MRTVYGNHRGLRADKHTYAYRRGGYVSNLCSGAFRLCLRSALRYGGGFLSRRAGHRRCSRFCKFFGRNCRYNRSLGRLYRGIFAPCGALRFCGAQKKRVRACGAFRRGTYRLLRRGNSMVSFCNGCCGCGGAALHTLFYQGRSYAFRRLFPLQKTLF